MLPAPVAARTTFGRYEIVHPLAAGGMGTVYLGRMRAARGVSMNVAIKRINAALAGDPHVMGMFVDEARITSLVRHPNVVQTLDVVEESGELLLVMEYVHGVSLARLLAAARLRKERLPLAIAARIASDVLHGLHAAHETTNEQGKSLEIVHRDVSPQNILVGVDGISRVADFGIARAANQVETTRVGELKGKLRYIAPEQFGREAVDRRADIYSAGLLLWEMIAGTAMRGASSPGGLSSAILVQRVEPPSSWVPEVPPALDDVVLKALANEPRDRFPFAAQMAVALEAAMTPAPYANVAELVRDLAHEEMAERKALLERAAAIPMDVPSAPTSVPSVPSAPSFTAATSSAAIVTRASPLPMEPSSPAIAKASGRRKRVLAWCAGALVFVGVALLLRRPASPPPHPPPRCPSSPAPSRAPPPPPPRAPEPPPRRTTHRDLPCARRTGGDRPAPPPRVPARRSPTARSPTSSIATGSACRAPNACDSRVRLEASAEAQARRADRHGRRRA